jgi:hypothetical protein
MYICDDAVSNRKSFTDFDYSYQPPANVSDISSVLAGTYNFQPAEVEVFYLV